MTSPAIAFGKSKEGVDYQSLDGQPAHLFFMIAAPEGGAQTHLDALAKLSGILMDDTVREIYYRLIRKKKYFVLLMMLMMKQLKKKKEAQEQEDEAQATTGASANDNANEPYVLAVTACQQVLHIRIWPVML